MNVAVLRIEGEDASLAAVKATLCLESELEWVRGEKARSGKVHAASGFSVTVADVSTPNELKQAVVGFVRLCGEKGIAFQSIGLTAEVSLGVTVGDSVQFVAGFEFSPAELGVFAARGIGLSITAYPTSDEANAEEAT